MAFNVRAVNNGQAAPTATALLSARSRRMCLARFISYPSEHALVAHVLWCAHTHLMDCWETTPRLAFMSAEKESGKTRALEITALLVKEPILSISASPAVIIRLIAKGRPTILYDEVDAVFGNAKAQEANADLRSVLNGGYRRGAKVHRCTTNGRRSGSRRWTPLRRSPLPGSGGYRYTRLAFDSY